MSDIAPLSPRIMNVIDVLQYECHQYAKGAGFWDELDPNDVHHVLSKLALIHSEVSEALEAARKGDDENFAEELADILIRIFDLAGATRVNLGFALIQKMNKNKTRPYKHGKLA